MLIHLIYASTANKNMSEDELLDILKKARKTNEKLNISGMLLYHDRSFLQVLEGEASAVEELYDRIKKDRRHHGVTLIASRKIKERNFPAWEMGFSNLKTVKPESVKGYSEYLQTPLNSNKVTKNPSFAHAFLDAFKSGYSA